MRRRSPLPIALAVLAGAGGLGLLFVGCDAGGGAGSSKLQSDDDSPGGTGGFGTGGNGNGGKGDGGDGPSNTIGVTVSNGSNASASTGVPVNPCGTECGPTELCDGVHKGIDDNCDGSVDEGCPCSIGQASDCFKGDPSYRDAPGCFPGSMQCTEFGTWGTCNGGAHAFGNEPCQEGSLEGCHPITAVPFQTVDLATGTGIFSQDADPGTATYTVECPAGVSPCPEPNGAQFQPLQSGEYTVTYTKLVDGEEEVCTYPLNVGARGLRVELTWNFAAGTDYDLHMMQPNINSVFNSGGSATDCTWNNCQVSNYAFGGGPEWFPQPPQPDGAPVAWFLDPTPELNSCYYSPRGAGQDWRDLNRGCHNPRIDLDNVSCITSISDPNDESFCAPENVNIDFPPSDQWVRLGVVHYSGSVNQPTMKIFCDGALAAVLGPEGYSSPVSFGGGSFSTWIAADVAFVADECGAECVVSPVYADPVGQTPLIVNAPAQGPAFPPLPEPGDE